ITPCISKDEICEIFGFGPAHTPGKTFFKDIYMIKPGHYGILNSSGFKEYCYWDLSKQPNADALEENISKAKDLVISSFNRDYSLGSACMLSGGLDSSILVSLASKETKGLKTYSIDYENNNINFQGSSYQPTQDKDFVKIMSDEFSTNHTTFSFKSRELFNSLYEAMLAREMPGMADVDSSMLLFLKAIKNDGINTILSGECSDEIFAGYPWYYKEELMYSFPFPWAKSLELRENILNTNIVSNEYLEEYINNKVNNNVNNLDFEHVFDLNCYNTIKWFMACLVERTERMADYIGIDVRTPFAEYKLFEYIYNISAKRKLGLESKDTPVEKHILRKAFEDMLPENIVYRKKSPFPKTYDPKYLELLEKEIKNIINKSTSPLLEIINVEFLYELLSTHGANLKENWFGQLMTYPQTLAYLIQINLWLTHYNIKILV
ncbi:MAG: asparagine synthase C-terminal domain-containing protein, partial [Clostridia bacterium]|nr:asparagine synthase C-terminal domain-containing protein [Clostridia bacterium]